MTGVTGVHVSMNKNSIDLCPVGEYSIEGDGYGPCDFCPDGSWQNETGMSFCYNCTNSTHTGGKGATSSNECG